MNRQKLIELARMCLHYECTKCGCNQIENCKDYVIRSLLEVVKSDGRQISQMEARLTGEQKQFELPPELMDRMTISLSIAELRDLLLKEGRKEC